MSKATNPEKESSISCGFYNAYEHDRVYDAADLTSLVDGIIRDGVFASVGTCFAVKADSGNRVTAGIGRAWFDHTWTVNDAPFPIDLEESEVLLDRIDAIVIEVNATTSIRDNFIKMVKGVPGSSPARPQMENSKYVHQHPLCYIYRKAGSTEIVQADITNMVGTTECPFVVGILEIVDVSFLLSQWEDMWKQFYNRETADMLATKENWKQVWETWFNAQTAENQKVWNEWLLRIQTDFDTWFNSLQIILEGDVAANLANEILKLKEKVTPSFSASVTVPISGWSTEAPYEQTVLVAGMKEEYDCVYAPNITREMTLEQEKEIKKSCGFISTFETVSGGITLTCKGKKPTVDIPLEVKAV